MARLLSLSVLLILLGVPADAGHGKSFELNDILWVLGTWARELPDQRLCESWSRSGEHEFLGKRYLVSYATGIETPLDTRELVEAEGTVTLTVLESGGNVPREYRMTSSRLSSAVFSSQGDDRLVYDFEYGWERLTVLEETSSGKPRSDLFRALPSPEAKYRAEILPHRERATIPFHLRGHIPYVTVMVGDNGPYPFMLDTGHSVYGSVSPAFARAYGRSPGDSLTVWDATGVWKRGEIVLIDNLRIGPLTLPECPFLVIKDDDEPPSSGMGGILGFGLFKNVLLTIDYPRREVYIEADTLPQADDQEIFNDPWLNNAPEVTFHLENRELPLLLDSGSVGWIMFPIDRPGNLPIEKPPDYKEKLQAAFRTFSLYHARLQRPLVLGRYELPNPVIQLGKDLIISSAGGDFMRNFVVSFDQRTQRVRLLREDTTPLPDHPEPR